MAEYEADGTIHVCYGSSGKVEDARFIPSQYVEQSGREFIVFVPREVPESSLAVRALAVRALAVRADESNGVELAAGNFDALLLHAALRRTKVTVLVSYSENGKPFFTLKGITIPAIPKKPSTG